jgi:threonine synthase
MDIQVASNFERALFEACDRDASWTAAAMRDFARDKRLGIPQEVLARLRSRYSAFAADDNDTRAAIAAIHKQTGRIIDPHTAVGAAAALQLEKTASPVVILSTAHAAKFPDAVTQAIGAPPPEPKRLAGLKNLPERLDVLGPDLALIKQFISSRLAP